MIRKPHINTLSYKFVTEERISYKNPPPVEDETELFKIKLDNNIVTLIMKEHYSSEKLARKIAEEYLEAWAIDACLREKSNKLSFKYYNAEIVDLDPPPTKDVQVLAPTAIASAEGMGQVTVHVIRAEYPMPPKFFKVTPDVRSMWDRYNQYLKGNDTIASMAYFCLTVLQYRFQTKYSSKIGKELNLSGNIIKKLSYLSSNVGDSNSARKRHITQYRAYNASEIRWLEAVVNILIRRLGEVECIPEVQLKEITMHDLPKQ